MGYFYANKLPHWPIIVGLVILAGTLVFNRAIQKNEPPKEPIQFRMDRPMPLIAADESGKEISKIAKGETLTFLGVTPANEANPVGIMVERENGERGILSTLLLGFPFVREDGKDSAEVYVKKKAKSKGRYVFVDANKKEHEGSLSYIRPILPEGFRTLRLRPDGDYTMSKKKFERLYLGHSLAENDRRYRMAWHIKKTKTGFEAFYPNIEILDRAGKRFNPIIEYNADSIATGYKYSESHVKDFNRWWINILPFSETLTDWDPFARLIEESMYEPNIGLTDADYSEPAVTEANKHSAGRWTLSILMLIFGTAWLFCLPMLIMFIADCTLYFHYTYYHLSDTAVKILFGVVAGVATYIWVVLASVWGCHWLFTPLIMFAGAEGWGIAVRHLDKPIPRERCTQCRRMEVNDYIGKEYVRSFYEWRDKSIAVNERTTHRWKTWDKVTEFFSNGSTRTYDTNIREHKRTETDYFDYRVKYKVDVYAYTYECRGCGHKERIETQESTEVDRELQGQHTSVHES